MLFEFVKESPFQNRRGLLYEAQPLKNNFKEKVYFFQDAASISDEDIYVTSNPIEIEVSMGKINYNSIVYKILPDYINFMERHTIVKMGNSLVDLRRVDVSTYNKGKGIIIPLKAKSLDKNIGRLSVMYAIGIGFDTKEEFIKTIIEDKELSKLYRFEYVNYKISDDDDSLKTYKEKWSSIMSFSNVVLFFANKFGVDRFKKNFKVLIGTYLDPNINAEWNRYKTDLINANNKGLYTKDKKQIYPNLDSYKDLEITDYRFFIYAESVEEIATFIREHQNEFKGVFISMIGIIYIAIKKNKNYALILFDNSKDMLKLKNEYVFDKSELDTNEFKELQKLAENLDFSLESVLKELSDLNEKNKKPDDEENFDINHLIENNEHDNLFNNLIEIRHLVSKYYSALMDSRLLLLTLKNEVTALTGVSNKIESAYYDELKVRLADKVESYQEYKSIEKIKNFMNSDPQIKEAFVKKIKEEFNYFVDSKNIKNEMVPHILLKSNDDFFYNSLISTLSLLDKSDLIEYDIFDKDSKSDMDKKIFTLITLFFYMMKKRSELAIIDSAEGKNAIKNLCSGVLTSCINKQEVKEKIDSAANYTKKYVNSNNFTITKSIEEYLSYMSKFYLGPIINNMRTIFQSIISNNLNNNATKNNETRLIIYSIHLLFVEFAQKVHERLYNTK